MNDAQDFVGSLPLYYSFKTNDFIVSNMTKNLQTVSLTAPYADGKITIAKVDKNKARVLKEVTIPKGFEGTLDFLKKNSISGGLAVAKIIVPKKVSSNVENIKELTYNENGQYGIYPEDGYDSMSGAIVNVNVQPQLENRFFTITQIYNSNENPFLITKSYDNCYGLGEVRIVKDIEIPKLINNSVKDITTNGMHYIDPPDGYDGIRRAIANVNVPTPSVEIGKSYRIDTNNTTINITPDQGYDAMDSVRITVDVPEEGAQLQTKEIEITENGTQTIYPSGGYDGISEMIINTNVSNNMRIQNKMVTFTTNGIQDDITADEGYDVLGTVIVTNAVVPQVQHVTPYPTRPIWLRSTGDKTVTIEPDIDETTLKVNPIDVEIMPSLWNLTVTENGVYTLADIDAKNKCGIGPLMVNVPPEKQVVQSFNFNLNDSIYDINEQEWVKCNSTQNIIVEAGLTLVVIEYNVDSFMCMRVIRTGSNQSRSITVNTGVNYTTMRPLHSGFIYFYKQNNDVILRNDLLENNYTSFVFYKDSFDYPEIY